MKYLTSTWREIVYPSGKTISQVNRYKPLDNKLYLQYNCIYKKRKGLIMKQAINIRLEKDIVQHLDEYANELDKTRTNLIEKAIEFYFDKLDEMVADKRIDNLKSGKTKVVPLEVVFAQAGINV